MGEEGGGFCEHPLKFPEEGVLCKAIVNPQPMLSSSYIRWIYEINPSGGGYTQAQHTGVDALHSTITHNRITSKP